MPILLASLLIIGNPAIANLAQDSTAAAVPAAKPAKPKKERKICRTDAKTSSRIPISTCKTAAEWKLVDGGITDALIAGNVGH